MSSKTLGAACLVAGTTIGAGMLALPLTISALGLVGGTAAMVIIWLTMYLAGLYGLELNLRAGKGLTLGGLGQFFSGPIARILGDASLVILTYALMAAYLFGGASLLETFLNQYTAANTFHAFSPLAMIVVTIVLILMGNLRWVDHHNRFLFLIMLAAMITLILGLGSALYDVNLTAMTSHWQEASVWQVAIPVLFTSFGYHIIQNTMVIYCDYNANALKKAFFWGSLMPLVAYVAWVLVTLIILYLRAPVFYQILITQKAELGQLMQALSEATGHSWLQPVSWIVGLLAILTSAVGVGLAIISFWEQHLPERAAKRPFILVLALIPPLLIGLFTPGVFIRALGFAGLILTIIAIFLPIYLLRESDKQTANSYPSHSLQAKMSNTEPTYFFYSITTSKFLRTLVFVIGSGVVVCEVCNICGF
ncbi:amino acid permease [Candidatus Paracaedibacter symbiosus]|uniref:amino acid permease n=1 Tax=Candidatus Paracaedibacter symbiosus TaxID=244582 RepID=UPI000509A450|nr:aromatic amino acid transport family protein [Candidatus Paracaedibacter symbiosus]